MVITYSKGKDQPGKVVNPARGQLNRENVFFPVPVRFWNALNRPTSLHSTAQHRGHTHTGKNAPKTLQRQK